MKKKPKISKNTILRFETPIGLFTTTIQIHKNLYFLKLGFAIIQNDTNELRKEMLTVKPNSVLLSKK
ncbi:hypothetical protein TNCT_376541 [Trichonephila clavata]|uniref:Uncharacterized protein n=1 Tax=Trichonephila clavata TaxID=2740835 RepID=A0A8X6KE36_TRICU|nr:hypothetical protein TNCT_376541 [Trichonephila clavata]